MRCILLVFLMGSALQAATIRAVGVLGNSGVAGEGRMRVTGCPLENCSSGAALDSDGALWLSGGDAINRVGLDGHLIERFPLEPAGSVVDSRTFAVLNRGLYFLARTKEGTAALFGLPMQRGAKAQPLPVKLPERKHAHVAYCLAPQPLDGRLVLATQPKAEEDRIDVHTLDPAAGDLKLAFSLKGQLPQGVAVDAQRKIIYVGGDFGLYVGGETHGTVFAITAARPDGTPVSKAFPVPCTKTPALPTQFRGVLSLAAGALWESAWYGFLARLDLEGRGAPGRVVEWHHELHYPTQFLGVFDSVGGSSLSHEDWTTTTRTTTSTTDGKAFPARVLDPLVIATPMPDAFYFAVWDNSEQRLRLVRRIGCLPFISSLGLSEEGWVTVGTARTQLWWRWGDAPDAPPRKAELHIAVTPVAFHGERCLGLAAQYHLTQLRNQTAVPTVFSPAVGDRNEAHRMGKPVPMKQPVGLSVQAAPGKQNGGLFVTDAATKQLWRADFWLPELRPTNEKWEPVAIEGGPLRAPTDVAALTDGRLLVADEGRILCLAPKGDTYRVAWQFDRWGEGAHEQFGKRLRLAVDGSWLLVSDTDRHRVLWLEWPAGGASVSGEGGERMAGPGPSPSGGTVRPRALGQLGETDRPGDDAGHLNGPTFVALRGTRAVVADAGNQRIVEFALDPER